MKRVFISCVLTLCLSFVQTCVATASLKGSNASQEKQNEEADRSGLVRIENDEILSLYKERGLLVQIPSGPGVRVDARLDAKWAWVRPWTAEFLSDLGFDFYQKFFFALPVSSAVRTLEYQRELRRTNGNAAPMNGSRRSSHLTGATIDITKRCFESMPCFTVEQINWIAIRLLVLERAGCIEATEEFNQSVFHIMVFRDYPECVIQARVLWENPY